LKELYWMVIYWTGSLSGWCPCEPWNWERRKESIGKFKYDLSFWQPHFILFRTDNFYSLLYGIIDITT